MTNLSPTAAKVFNGALLPISLGLGTYDVYQLSKPGRSASQIALGSLSLVLSIGVGAMSMHGLRQAFKSVAKQGTSRPGEAPHTIQPAQTPALHSAPHFIRPV